MTELVDAYAPIDAAAVRPVLEELIEADLEVTAVRAYRVAVDRLKKLYRLAVAVGPDAIAAARLFVGMIREANRQRPRFIETLDRARLPKSPA